MLNVVPLSWVTVRLQSLPKPVVVILPVFILEAFLERRRKLPENVFVIGPERGAEQALYVLGHDGSRPGLPDTAEQLRPKIPVVVVPAVNTTQAPWLTRHSTRHHIDPALIQAEIDPPNIALNQRPTGPRLPGPIISWVQVSGGVQAQSLTTAMLELIHQQVLESRLMHRPGKAAAAGEQLQARSCQMTRGRIRLCVASLRW